MTTREIRLRAAEILEASADAWCQGEMRCELPDGRYAYCLIGACLEAAGYFAAVRADASGASARATVDAAYAAADLASCVPGVADTWNDDPERTREQVIAALRAIEVLP